MHLCLGIHQAEHGEGEGQAVWVAAHLHLPAGFVGYAGMDRHQNGDVGVTKSMAFEVPWLQLASVTEDPERWDVDGEHKCIAFRCSLLTILVVHKLLVL